MGLFTFYIIIFLLLSAFFSGSETAFFSLSKIQIKKLELKKSPFPRKVVNLLKKPRKLLITILLGNTIVNVVFSTLASLFVYNYVTYTLGKDHLPFWILTLSMFVITLLLILFGEIIPKLFAITKAESYSLFSSSFIVFISYLLYPIIIVLVLISRVTSQKSDGQYSHKTKITSQDLKNIVNSKPKHLPLDENEKKIISGIFNFTSTDAKKIMVPRVDIKCVSVTENLESVKNQIIESGHSRLPVFEDSIDNLVGIIFAKDIILNQNINSIQSILRVPIYVTENTKIQTLLNLFLAKKTHLAIVVDEYGGTSGLISLEDILEELVGEIVDEYDKEQPLLTRNDQNEYIASGMLSVTELNKELELDLDAERYDNIAAFLYDKFNHVPKAGERLDHDNKAEFIVMKVTGQRIETVKIIINEDENGNKP